MDCVRVGIIGTGGMGQCHLGYMGDMDGVKLAALADIDKAKVDRLGAEKNLPVFYTGEALLDSGLVDAVLIATPHYFHPPLAIEAFKRGIHVLSEKPLGVDKNSVMAAIKEHEKHPELVFSIMFQMRTQSRCLKLRELIQSGQLGQLTRIVWVVTSWFRPQVYYDSGTWRATWKGEGGGVLMNQCPHNLDMWQWLFGLPQRLQAHLGLGKYHHIEVEDEATAYMEYANGATGLFVTSTGEAPGVDRLEVSGDNGKVLIEGDRFEFIRNSTPASEFCHLTNVSFSCPPVEVNSIKPVQLPGAGGHQTITRNFIDAILKGTPLIVSGREGLGATELINAMQLSGIRGKMVDLPVDGAEYTKLLEELKASSQEKTQAKQAVVNMQASFKA